MRTPIRHLLAIVLGITTVGFSAAEAFGAEAKGDFYVALDGNDSWSGTLPEANGQKTDGPFATLGAARDAARRLRAKGNIDRPVTVLVRGGTYWLAEPLEFRPEDSGTEKSPLVFAAYPGEKPILSGGRPITGWKKAGGQLWSATVPQVQKGEWYFKQLFVDGQRQIRARHPNGDEYLRTEGPIEPLGDRQKARQDKTRKIGFRYAAGDLRKWENLEDVNVIAYHAWTASWHWIESLDEAQRIVRFTAPSGWPMTWWEKNQRYYVENCQELLDSPGEWYLNRRTGVVSCWPAEGVDMARAQVVAPALQQVVRFAGDGAAGKFVEHVQLRGLSFQHTDWFVKDKGVADGQSGVNFLKAAIYATGARSCAVEDCEIAHIGEYAIWLGPSSSNNLVRRCHIHDMGGGGVCIGDPRRSTKSADETRLDASANTVDNNFIHDGGQVFRQCVGVWIGQSSQNTVTHNEISDLFYSGVSVGWTWGYGTSGADHNHIDFNHIHHLGAGVLSDMGGIYSLGISPGTTLRCNLIHDVYSYSYGGWGLYTDEGSTGILLENNIVYNTKTGGFHQHYGKENTIRNNIFAFCWEGQIKRSRKEPHRSFTFERNIVYCDNKEMLGGNWDDGNYAMDQNLYWNAAASEVDFMGKTFAAWQATGQDKHSLVADPLFADPKHYDFTLKAGSPAAQIGFQPIDTSRIGLYGEKSWTDAPKAIVRKPYKVPPLPPKKP